MKNWLLQIDDGPPILIGQWLPTEDIVEVWMNRDGEIQVDYGMTKIAIPVTMLEDLISRSKEFAFKTRRQP